MVPWTWLQPAAHGLQRIGDAGIAVVVGVDAQRHAWQPAARRRYRCLDPAPRGARSHRFGDLPGQAAAVGVAEHDAVRAADDGGLQCGQRVLGVGPIAVEEVLGVVDHLFAVALDDRRPSPESCAGSLPVRCAAPRSHADPTICRRWSPPVCWPGSATESADHRPDRRGPGRWSQRRRPWHA